MQIPDFNTIFERVWAEKVPFFLTFFLVTLITYTCLVIIDFIPEPVGDESTEPENSTVVVEKSEPETIAVPEAREPTPRSANPTRIIIDEIGTDIEVFNPDTIDVAQLDEVLLDGVARHPLSADFQDKGNMLIFGHSSYLPNVLNSNFQAFNGVQKLTWGDKIRVESNDMVYEYRVDRVYEAKASDTVIDNARGEATLTLVTCNSFATTDDRFIVEATLVGEKPLS